MRLCGHERLEDLIRTVNRQADTRVADANEQIIVRGALHRNRQLSARVLHRIDGVQHQIHEHLLHLDAIRHDLRDALGDDDSNRNRRCGGLLLQEEGHLSNHGTDAHAVAECILPKQGARAVDDFGGAVRPSTFILIDEPELSLHPSLQLDFIDALSSYASQGVIFATHSLGLARTAAEYSYALRKENNAGAIMRPFDELPRLGEFVAN